MRRIILVLGLVGLTAAAWDSLPGPRTARGQVAPIGVSADSIVATARVLSGETGLGPESRLATRPSTTVYADYLRERLKQVVEPLGGTVTDRRFDPGFETIGGDSIRHPYINITATIPGRLTAETPGFFLLGAHFDATAQRDEDFEANWMTHAAPGADDNASGVAAVLEALRVAGVNGTLPQGNLLITFFDGEEQQVPEKSKFLLGAAVMAGDDLDSLEAVHGPLHAFLNADMVAYNPRGDSLVVLTNTRSRGLANTIMAVYEDADIPDFVLSRVVEGLRYSDHGPFWEVDRDAILFIENSEILDHAPHYHKDTDRVDATFSRGGSQAARASDLLDRMMNLWATGDGPSALTLMDDDVLVEARGEVNAEEVEVGEDVRLRVGVTNRGSVQRDDWNVTVTLELDGQVVDTLTPQSGPEILVPGGRAWLSIDWTPEERHAGSLFIRARINAPGDAVGESGEGGRYLAVAGEAAGIYRAYVYPNPTRQPDSAVLHYELSQGGPVRTTLVDITGAVLGKHSLAYDPVFPGDGVGVGQADIPLRGIFPVSDLAPGLYMIQIRLFDESGDTVVSQEVVKFAVLR